jgi:hypothetical protein
MTIRPRGLSLLCALACTHVACSSSESANETSAPDAQSAPEPDSGANAYDATREDTSTGVVPDSASGDDATDSTTAEDASADAGELDGDAATMPDSSTPNTLGLDPPMGWSSWSFVRTKPSEAVIKAQAQALHDSHLSDHGFVYVNIDDFYYLSPMTTVDMYGRWVVDSTKFPSGMAAMATFVHGLGLKFGMYVTPGIPVAAVTKNTPIEGTTAHAADIAITTKTENQYNVHGSMYYIDFTKPGSQEFIDSWAKLFASYGVDYIKLDGVGAADIPDVQAWSTALKNSGRQIHFELSNNLPIAQATTWQSLSNGWRIEGDVECYCTTGSSYPLTSWAKASKRFTDAVKWVPYDVPNARIDLDSLELGNGTNDGLTPDERQSVMSLWALVGAPFILGSDLTNLDPTDLPLMTNDEVIGVQQAGIAASQIAGGNSQIWASKHPDGSHVVGLFNLGAAAATVTVTWSQLGITGSANVRDLWAQKDLGSFMTSYGTMLPSHGVALVRVQ